MLIYSQSSGEISNSSDLIGTGWAGRGDCKNQPTMQDQKCEGPLPRGLYTLGAWEDQHPHLGPMVTHLSPDLENEMFGRDGFFIHGPSMGANYGQESMGCIVLPHDIRLKVKDTGEVRLQVVE